MPVAVVPVVSLGFTSCPISYGTSATSSLDLEPFNGLWKAIRCSDKSASMDQEPSPLLSVRFLCGDRTACSKELSSLLHGSLVCLPDVQHWSAYLTCSIQTVRLPFLPSTIKSQLCYNTLCCICEENQLFLSNSFSPGVFRSEDRIVNKKQGYSNWVR